MAFEIVAGQLPPQLISSAPAISYVAHRILSHFIDSFPEACLPMFRVLAKAISTFDASAAFPGENLKRFPERAIGAQLLLLQENRNWTGIRNIETGLV